MEDDGGEGRPAEGCQGEPLTLCSRMLAPGDLGGLHMRWAMSQDH